MSIHRLSLSISYLIQSLEEEEQKLGPTKENPHFETPNAIQCHGMEPMTNILIKLSYWMYLEASLRFNCPIPEPVALLNFDAILMSTAEFGHKINNNRILI